MHDRVATRFGYGYRLPEPNEAPAMVTLLFDLDDTGHHPSYLSMLFREAQRLDPQKSFVFLVSHRMAEMLVGTIEEGLQISSNVKILSVALEITKRRAEISGFRLGAFDWALLTEYAVKVQAEAVIALYMDHLQVAAAVATNNFKFSGIYFRPTFHYSRSSTVKHWLSDAIRSARQKFVLALLCNRRKTGTIFCLDPDAVLTMNQWWKRCTVQYLADPVQAQISDGLNPSFAAPLNDSGRIIILLFGEMRGYKGIGTVLTSLGRLEQTFRRRLMLLVVGRLDRMGEDALNAFRATEDRSEGVVCDARIGYVPESEVGQYFLASNFVLLPYVRHVGSSGVLIQAAVLGIPVLGPDYGLVGAMIARHRLGIAVDMESEIAIGNGIRHMVESDLVAMGRGIRSEALAAEHNSDRFCKAILK